MTILTREQIDQRVATSLPDLLATQPGFSLGRTGPEGGQTSLFLDGGNSNYTKVLVDGVPANTPGGLIDFSNFTLDNIDKIEVVHGAESALYGSDAMDGVIQIFTHLRTAATSLRAMVGRSFPACSADSITQQEFPISKRLARAPMTHFAIERSLEISAGAYPIRRE
jgi:vitamin B12 transporter